MARRPAAIGPGKPPLLALLTGLALLALLAGPAPRPARASSLPELERSLADAVQVREAEAQAEEYERLLDREEARSGLKLFGGLGAGRYQEQVSDSESRTYNQGRSQAGVSLPRLGSRERERQAVRQAEDRALEGRERLEIARRRALTALRERYVAYWAATRRLALAERFLSHEPGVAGVLTERVRAKRLLEADRREFMSAFEAARRDKAAALAARDQALEGLRLLAGGNAPTGDPAAPALPATELTEAALARLLAECVPANPEAQAATALVAAREQDLQRGTLREVDANLDLAGQYAQDDPGGPGYGVSVGFGMRMPLGVGAAGEADQAARQAALRRARLAAERRRAELTAELRDAFARAQAADASLRFAYERLGAAVESLRERVLRAEGLPGDVLEKKQQARFAVYQTAGDAIDAEAARLAARVRLLGASRPDQGSPSEREAALVGRRAALVEGALGDEQGLERLASDLDALLASAAPGQGDRAVRPSAGPAFVPSAGPVYRPAERPAGASAGVYLWRAEGVLTDPWAAFWNQAAQAGLDRVLLSLNRQEIEAAASDRGAELLRSFLREGARRGVRVELLLGEPTWILPERRGDLLAIVRAMSGFPFAGLHLDLEPEQLPPGSLAPQAAYVEVFAAVKAARQVSPWPVGVSLHPRALTGAARDSAVGRALLDAAPAEAALMVYVSNPKRAVQIAGPILDAFPDISFSLAQSVEKELPPAESHFRGGRAAYQARLEQIRTELARPNFRGVLTQDWAAYKDMAP